MSAKPSKKNNLSLHPISKEFDYEKNFPNKPENFTLFSGLKVWWRCDKTHSWEARIANRTKLKSGCPYCAGKKPSEENNLSLHPVSKEFHPRKNKDKTPQDFTLGSKRKVWWLCEKGHEWRATPLNRTISFSGCPYCAGILPSKENNLSLHKCSKEFHPRKNKDKTPEDFTFASDARIWWLCEKGHEWKAKVYSRTKLNSGCPECWKKTYRSKAEIELYEWCCETFSKQKIEANNRTALNGLEIDIWLPELNKGIEFNGNYWHSLSKHQKRDKRKLKEAKKREIEIIVIEENVYKTSPEQEKRKIKTFIMDAEKQREK